MAAANDALGLAARLVASCARAEGGAESEPDGALQDSLDMLQSIAWHLVPTFGAPLDDLPEDQRATKTQGARSQQHVGDADAGERATPPAQGCGAALPIGAH